MRKRFALIALAVIVCCAAGVGYYWYNKPHGSVQGETAAFTLNASELYQAFNSNEAEANKKYVNKVLSVHGEIAGIQQSGDQTIVQLNSGSAMGGISCLLGKGVHYDPSLNNKPVMIKGKCTGYLMDVNLVDCIIE